MTPAKTAPKHHKTTKPIDSGESSFRSGSHVHLYRTLGAHLKTQDGVRGCSFAVWAPHASAVSVVGDFNGWNPTSNPLIARKDGSGIWETMVPGVKAGMLYKYHIASAKQRFAVDKADPFAFHAETPPRTASIVWDLKYDWSDDRWMKNRRNAHFLTQPISIYEMHVGSWRRHTAEGGRALSYREVADILCPYVKEMGFTHVELMPVMEHPFHGSWGYQVTGYCAPTSRYGTPQDLMYFIDRLHQEGIGVILDWVPSHFPKDEHGLALFDGTPLYEYEDPRQGFHPDWKSAIFNYRKGEVRSFLMSTAFFWLDLFHVDGLRVDGVASMLYLDYSRKPGEWIPNEQGGRENLDAIEFLKRLNQNVRESYPDVLMIAEESTAWPMVSQPVEAGGLGFGFKWNMGWAHDTLEYFAQDPINRKTHQDKLTFSIWYAFSEHFILSLSHDEFAQGKKSLFGRMPGDEWQRYANTRLLLGYQYGHPGKKLLFMGTEIAQWPPWSHDGSIEWEILADPFHLGVQRWVRDLNALYRDSPALHTADSSPEGFQWIDFRDAENSVISFLRISADGAHQMLIVCNMTPVPRFNYGVGVPRGGTWREILNSDAAIYGGSNQGNFGTVAAAPISRHGRFHSLSLTLPPLGVIFLAPEGPGT